MAEVATKLRGALNKEKLSVKQGAKKLGVCRASLYKYLAKSDLPRLEVLQRAHDLWRLEFSYGQYNLDREFFRLNKRAFPKAQAFQESLPFLETLHEKDIRVMDVKAKKPNSVEVRIEITFSGDRKSTTA